MQGSRGQAGEKLAWRDKVIPVIRVRIESSDEKLMYCVRVIGIPTS